VQDCDYYKRGGRNRAALGGTDDTINDFATLAAQTTGRDQRDPLSPALD